MVSILKKKYYNFMISISGSEKRAKIYRKVYGVSIGKNVRFTGKPEWGTEPYLISIGNNVTVTQHVAFITHDGGVGLFRKEYPGINVFGRITIGDNVFIGARTIFLPGVTVGNNVVIAAGSIVTKDVKENSVIAGAPAKKLKSLDEYKQNVLKKAAFITESDYLKRKIEVLKHLEE
ncbi:acyltransferase [Lutimonas saemankumensis]|uniref:acyltransferase n=1 Tax=Lutimonas saemankumensis TaxID=483016 RepID=UPI001CD1A507|nr:acyltransferase [Lutimonas saemankumensis]MCA0931062.1 acyltransferase [Lutimonas saemankumensis]